MEAAVEMAKIMPPPPLELLGKPVECPVRVLWSGTWTGSVFS